MLYKRMPIEMESPEEIGYDSIMYNLAESSVTDLRFDELDLSLNNLKLEYIPHRGNALLRKEIIKGFDGLNENHVLVTNGAAGALFIVHSALLTSNDHLIVVRPNYATNIAVPEAIGCAISYIDLKFENAWNVDVNAIEQAISNTTKLISITTPHNPTGMVMDDKVLNDMVALAERKNIFLLVDETYRDAGFKTPYPIMASKSKKVISVSSLSKAFGLPGLRIGWLLSQDGKLMETFLAAKEMIYISNSALDEEVAHQFLKRKEKFAETIHGNVAANFKVLVNWLKQERSLECVLPCGGVVCFPRVRNAKAFDADKFYSTLMEKYKTMVGPGHWFSMPDYYFRLGFGWVDNATFAKGLENISLALKESKG
jgi:aspartate/methionine/tyrosine aminotransferase